MWLFYYQVIFTKCWNKILTPNLAFMPIKPLCTSVTEYEYFREQYTIMIRFTLPWIIYYHTLCWRKPFFPALTNRIKLRYPKQSLGKGKFPVPLFCIITWLGSETMKWHLTLPKICCFWCEHVTLPPSPRKYPPPWLCWKQNQFQCSQNLL